MPDDEPKISVLMPIYNTNPEHLRESIASVLGQTYNDFEFLILNDSPDNTELEAVVATFHDPRIIYARNERNMGISDARNKLVEMARGEYLAVMDHDDISLPERFEKEVEYLDSHPEVGVCSCWADPFPEGPDMHFPEENIEILKMLTIADPIVHPAAMIRKSVLEQHHLKYEKKYSPCEDYRLWICLMEHTCFHNIPEVLLKYRWHDDRTSVHKERALQSISKVLQLLAREKHPALFRAWCDDPVRERTIRIRLLGLKILEVRKFQGKTSIYLFGRVLLMRWTESWEKHRDKKSTNESKGLDIN